MSNLKVPDMSRAVYQWGGWTLYELPPRPVDSPLWCRFKLMLSPETPKKHGQVRAFALTWNPVEMRFRKDAVRVALELGHPDLYARVELTMSLTYGPEWLRDVQGMTATEIDAEKARLQEHARQRRRNKAAAPTTP